MSSARDALKPAYLVYGEDRARVQMWVRRLTVRLEEEGGLPPERLAAEGIQVERKKIDVPEPSISETVDILKGLKSRFEEHHNIKYSAKALRTAAELADRYINDRKLPDKAIDVIDEAGAAQMLVVESKRRKTIGAKEIEAVVANATMRRIRMTVAFIG